MWLLNSTHAETFVCPPKSKQICSCRCVDYLISTYLVEFSAHLDDPWPNAPPVAREDVELWLMVWEQTESGIDCSPWYVTFGWLSELSATDVRPSIRETTSGARDTSRYPRMSSAPEVQGQGLATIVLMFRKTKDRFSVSSLFICLIYHSFYPPFFSHSDCVCIFFCLYAWTCINFCMCV